MEQWQSLFSFSQTNSSNQMRWAKCRLRTCLLTQTHWDTCGLQTRREQETKPLQGVSKRHCPSRVSCKRRNQNCKAWHKAALLQSPNTAGLDQTTLALLAFNCEVLRVGLDLLKINAGLSFALSACDAGRTHTVLH